MWNPFKKKQKPVTVPITIGIQNQKHENKQKLFQCHYCYENFEVTAKMQFPVSVPSIHNEYHFQGIGVQCPKCLKTCIYG